VKLRTLPLHAFTGDRGFESISLQRGVRCEPDFLSPAHSPRGAVWEAMNILTAVDLHPNSPQISRLVAEAERALCRLTAELARDAELQNPSQHLHS
jgi:hypothetical protein